LITRLFRRKLQQNYNKKHKLQVPALQILALFLYKTTYKAETCKLACKGFGAWIA
jgi:hypothetical protein